MANLISDEVAKLKKKYDETDPFRLIQAMKIVLLFEPMGREEEDCKGFLIVKNRRKVIVINNDLPSEIQRIIAAHEVGHAALGHVQNGVQAFHEFSLFDQTSRLEYEANIFAADFLMDDDVVLELLNDDLSFFGAASVLGVPAELLDFKFRTLKRKGYKVIDPPLNANGCFLKRTL